MVSVTLLLFLVLLLTVFFGRIQSAQGNVEAAARAGAQAAAIQSGPSSVQSAAAAVANTTLASEHADCPSPLVSVDTSHFVAGGSVSVTITCVANLSNIASFGVIPGTKTFTASSTAPIDPYRTIGP
jgi:zona occludens toxin (predicted ATPase)